MGMDGGEGQAVGKQHPKYQNGNQSQCQHTDLPGGDGKNVTDFGSSGNGTNKVEINGGVGSINVRFEDGTEA
mgnify:CR=1 FL=1